LHDLGFVHCDLKPDNILLGEPDQHTIYYDKEEMPQFRIHLIDFGISHFFMRNFDEYKQRKFELETDEALSFVEREKKLKNLHDAHHIQNSIFNINPMCKFKGNLGF
jgi:serine/threonine protein kinase